MPAPLESVAACDLCGHTTFTPEAMYPEYLLFTGEEFQLVRCDACNLRFIDPRPPASVIGSYYPRGYFAHLRNPPRLTWWHRRLGEAGQPPLAPWEKAVVRVLETVSWYAIPRVRGQQRILDVGCGGGKLLDIARALGWQTHGVEPSLAGAQAAAAGAHDVVCASAEQAPFRPGSFDVVYLWHVLEHTHSPRKALEACHEALAPGGELMLCVPNHASFHARLFGRYWWSTDAPRHLYQFREDTLRRYLGEVGFTDVRVTTRTGTSSWVRGVRHTINGVFGTRLQNDPRWALALGEIPVMVSSLFRFFGVGSELRVTCRRE